MFDFGIAAAFRTMVDIYTFNARNTGRTTSMVNQLKQGDIVIFHDSMEADRIKRICKSKDFDIVTVVVSNGNDLHQKYDGLRSRKVQGAKLYFDHGFIEKHYLMAINYADGELRKMVEDFDNAYQNKLKISDLVTFPPP